MLPFYLVAKVALVKADDLGIAAVNVTASGTGLTAIPTLTLSSSDGFVVMQPPPLPN